jgi:hypothetical protein
VFGLGVACVHIVLAFLLCCSWVVSLMFSFLCYWCPPYFCA